MEKYRRKVEIVAARRHEGPRLTVVHDELGEQSAHKGDYLLGNERGKVRVMTAAAFEKDYELMGAAAVPESRVLAAARAGHEANRVLCRAQGDDSQPRWEDAPEWQQKSAVSGVKMILDNPETTPQQSHEGWLAVKAADGWKYGPAKDAKKKEHPCFVPYEELPEGQRLKDEMFGLVVRAVLGL